MAACKGEMLWYSLSNFTLKLDYFFKESQVVEQNTVDFKRFIVCSEKQKTRTAI